MRTTILVLMVAIVVSGCAGQGQYISSREFNTSLAVLDTCDQTGGTPVKLYYGYNGVTPRASAEIKIRGIAHVRAGEVFAIELKPKSNNRIRPGFNFEDAEVTISGKPGTNSDWIEHNPASYNDTAPNHELVICVPEGQPSGRYYYNIEIEDTGTLDPRADVDP